MSRVLSILVLVTLLAACTSAGTPEPESDGRPGDAGGDATGEVLAADVGADDLAPAETVCAPDCEGRACGDDGCGGSCGSCDDGDATTVDHCLPLSFSCAHSASGEVVPVLRVDEPDEVIPQTVIHLYGDSSYAAAGPISRYEWSVEQPALSASRFVPTSAYSSPTFEVNVAGKYVFRLSVWDALGQPCPSPAEIVVYAVPDQAVHVELLWVSPGDPNPDDEGPTAGTDLDLHFAHPSAAQPDLDGDGLTDPWFDRTWDTFWFYPLQNWGSASNTDDDPSLDRDDVDGNGPENINLGEPAEGATYAIGVNFWDDHGFGPAFATVRVYVWAALVYETPEPLVLHDHDLWWVATLAWPGGQVTPKLTPEGGAWLTHDYHHAEFYQP